MLSMILILTQGFNYMLQCSFGSPFRGVRGCYHVVKEVHSPVEGLTDASDVLQPLGATVVLADFIDGEAGRRDGVTCHHTYSHEELEHSLDTVRKT